MLDKPDYIGIKTIYYTFNKEKYKILTFVFNLKSGEAESVYTWIYNSKKLNVEQRLKLHETRVENLVKQIEKGCENERD